MVLENVLLRPFFDLSGDHIAQPTISGIGDMQQDPAGGPGPFEGDEMELLLLEILDGRDQQT